LPSVIAQVSRILSNELHFFPVSSVVLDPLVRDAFVGLGYLFISFVGAVYENDRAVFFGSTTAQKAKNVPQDRSVGDESIEEVDLASASPRCNEGI